MFKKEEFVIDWQILLDVLVLVIFVFLAIVEKNPDKFLVAVWVFVALLAHIQVRRLTKLINEVLEVLDKENLQTRQ